MLEINSSFHPEADDTPFTETSEYLNSANNGNSLNTNPNTSKYVLVLRMFGSSPDKKISQIHIKMEKRKLQIIIGIVSTLLKLIYL